MNKVNDECFPFSEKEVYARLGRCGLLSHNFKCPSCNTFFIFWSELRTCISQFCVFFFSELNIYNTILTTFFCTSKFTFWNLELSSHISDFCSQFISSQYRMYFLQFQVFFFFFISQFWVVFSRSLGKILELQLNQFTTGFMEITEEIWCVDIVNNIHVCLKVICTDYYRHKSENKVP